uniref:Uncharacterized protein n=1 Tax=Panagrolaimus sp. ES5 TaxID=591445 RepID=A0AC34FMT6_9BILA
MEQNKTNSSKSAKDRAIDTLRRIQRVFLNMTKKHDAKPNEDGQNEFESEEEPTADISSSENVTKYKADGSGKAMKKADSDIDQHTGLREKIPANDVAEKTLKKRSSAKKKSPPKTKKTSKPIEADKNEIESEEEPSMNLKKKVQKGDRSGRALKKVKSTTSSQSEGISKESEIDKQSGLRKIIPAHDIGEKPSKKRSSVKKISSPKQKKRSSKSSGNQNQQTKTKININPCSKQYRRHH